MVRAQFKNHSGSVNWTRVPVTTSYGVYDVGLWPVRTVYGLVRPGTVNANGEGETRVVCLLLSEVR